jgi:hypothetical protein
MNEGVKILLERMKTNPEEFIAPIHTGASKWGHLIEVYKDSLDVEDQQAIKDGYKKIHQQRFTESVMRELLAPEKDWDDDMKKYFSHNLSSGTLSATLTPSPSIPSITLDAQKYQTEMMKRHLDTHREQINAMKVQVRKKAALKKEHKTLFGKLFNYS